MSKAQGEQGKGLKANNNKMLMSLLPSPALYEIARVLTYGANKYTICNDCKATFQHNRTICSECGSTNIISGAHNWSKGMNWSWIIDALERHLDKFKCGIDLDKESGLLHSSQIACNALFLLTFQVMNIGKDDRWKPTADQLKHMDELRVWLDQAQQQTQQGIKIDLSLDGEFKSGINETLELDEDNIAELYQLAKEQNCTVNELVYKMLNNVLGRQEKE